MRRGRIESRNRTLLKRRQDFRIADAWSGLED